MVETGIKEYDELKARIGFIDVDVLRYDFIKAKEKYERLKTKLDKIVLEKKK